MSKLLSASISQTVVHTRSKRLVEVYPADVVVIAYSDHFLRKDRLGDVEKFAKLLDDTKSITEALSSFDFGFKRSETTCSTRIATPEENQIMPLGICDYVYETIGKNVDLRENYPIEATITRWPTKYWTLSFG